jgi:hypothetical protein
MKEGKCQNIINVTMPVNDMWVIRCAAVSRTTYNR